MIYLILSERESFLYVVSGLRIFWDVTRRGNWYYQHFGKKY